MTRFQRQVVAEVNQSRIGRWSVNGIKRMLSVIRAGVLPDGMATFIGLAEGVHKENPHIDMNLIDEGAELIGGHGLSLDKDGYDTRGAILTCMNNKTKLTVFLM